MIKEETRFLTTMRGDKMDATNKTRVLCNLLRNHLRQLGSRLPPGLRRHGKGQGLLEFALILPALLLVVLGIIEFGYVFTVYTTMFNAAREGARYGMVNPRDTAGIFNATMNKIYLADHSQVYISVTCDEGPGDPPTTIDCAIADTGDRVLVNITYDLPTITPAIQPIAETLPIETESARTIASIGQVAIFGDPSWQPGDEEGESSIAVSVTVDPNTVYNGEEVTFTYVVTNTGDLPLTNVIIADSFGNTFTIPQLIPGDTQTFTQPEPIYTTTTNTVTATGDDQQGGAPFNSDSATVTVIGPALDLTVTVDPQVTYRGSEVIFTYSVQNTGDADLTNVSVVDSLGTPLNTFSLAVGDPPVFWNDIRYVVYGTTTNDVVATAEDPIGEPVRDVESVTVIVTVDPIIINEPLDEGDTAVNGTAEAGRTVSIRDLMSDTFPSSSFNVQEDKNFEFNGLPPLVRGHVIVVEGYGRWDTAVVGGQGEITPITIVPHQEDHLCHASTTITGTAEPNQTLTLVITGTTFQEVARTDVNGGFVFDLSLPLQYGQIVGVSGYGESASMEVMACTSNAYITIEPQCAPSGQTVITVRGHNWRFQNKQDDATIYWNGNPAGTYDTPQTPPAPWSQPVTINIPAGIAEYEIRVRSRNADVTTIFASPCPAPNLIITDLSLVSTGVISTYQPVDFSATVENIGTRPVNSLFWVDIYSAAPTSQTTGIAWGAVSSLGVEESATITITLESGFEVTGTHQVWSFADSWYQVSELDENDNQAGPISVTVPVTGTPPATPPTTTTVGSIVGQTWIALSGFPVPHGRADVWCTDALGDEIASTISGEDGGYTLADLPTGTYTVWAETWIDGTRYIGSRNNVLVEAGEDSVAIVIMY